MSKTAIANARGSFQYEAMKKKSLARWTSRVKNGHLALPAGLQLADGAKVELIPLVALPSDSRFLKGVLKMAKPRNWPRDFALNHGHYTKGYPKK
jgi:hypothetical protein